MLTATIGDKTYSIEHDDAWHGTDAEWNIVVDGDVWDAYPTMRAASDELERLVKEHRLETLRDELSDAIDSCDDPDRLAAALALLS